MTDEQRKEALLGLALYLVLMAGLIAFTVPL